MDCVAYYRVSTNNQKEEGTIQLQIKECRKYSIKNKLNIVAEFTDEGISGSKELAGRKGLSSLWDYLEEKKGHVEAVLVWKMDRLARNLYFQEHLIKKFQELDLQLLSCKEPDLDSKDPLRTAFRQFLGIVGQLEGAFIAMRLEAGRISKAEQAGYAGGGIARGYRVENGDLVKDEDEIKLIKHIQYLKSRKKYGYRKIANTLNAEGVPPKRGKIWYPMTIKYILSNPIYKGRLHYSGITTFREDLALNSKTSGKLC